MVSRQYYCKGCEHEFETSQPMNEELLTKCPKCKKKKLIQDLSGNFHGSVIQYNTVASIAEKNSRDLGNYGRQAKEQEIIEKEKSIKKNRADALRAKGLNPIETRDKKPSQLPDHVLLSMNRGDEKAVERYIYEGR